MRKFKLKAMILLFALSFMNTGCFEDGKSDSSQSVLALITALTNNPIAGTYDSYNGTTAYPGDTYSAPGTEISGEFTISNTLISQTVIDATYGNSYLYGEIKEIDASKQVIYVRFREDSSYSVGSYAWYRWTINGGYLYLCPDLTGVSSQTTLALAKADDLDYYSDPNNINSGCGLNSSYSPIFWSRLQPK